MYALLALAFAEDPATPVAPVAPAPPAPEGAAPAVAPVPTPEGVVATPPAPPVATPPEGAPVIKAPSEPAVVVTVPQTDAEAAKQGAEAFDAIEASKWGSAVALLLGLLAFAYNKYAKGKTPPPATP